MEAKIYVLTKIEGDYAYLCDEAGEELFIAMALLPAEADIGTMLQYENFEFQIAEN